MRILAYLQQMAPLPVAATVGFSKFFAIYFSLQVLYLQTPLTVTYHAVLGACTMVLFLILLRVYDELKDMDSDRRLAAAGDPRYVNRPIVTGLITDRDLSLLRDGISLLLILINLSLGVAGFIAFCAIMLFLWLSSRWFFLPAIKHNLILAFVTHNPLALVMAGYAALVFHIDFTVTPQALWTLVLLAGIWLPAATWETSRKLRIPEDETDYDTYTKILGWRTAALVPMVFAVAATGLLLAFMIHNQIAVTYPAYLTIVTLAFSLLCLRFRLWPRREHTHLQPYSEFYLISVDLGMGIAMFAQFGLA